MTLEDLISEHMKALKENTAALNDHTKAIGGAVAAKAKPATAATAKPAAAKPAAKKNDTPTEDDVLKKFGGYLGTTDKAERAERKEHVLAIIGYFGVAKATELEAKDRAEALGYLDQYIAGETPEFADGGGEEEEEEDGDLI